jgi:hypothetical protein
LSSIKISSTTSFGGEVKLSGPCKILHFKDPLRYDRDADTDTACHGNRTA